MPDLNETPGAVGSFSAHTIPNNILAGRNRNVKDNSVNLHFSPQDSEQKHALSALTLSTGHDRIAPHTGERGLL